MGEVENTTMDISVVEKKVFGMNETVENTKIESEKDLSKVADTIKNIKVLGKFVKAEKEKFTKPAQEIINNARAKFLPFKKACNEAEASLKSKVNIYMTEVERVRQEKEDKIAKRAEKGTIKEETAVKKLDDLGDTKKTVDTGTSQVQQKKIKKVEIVDREKIPHEYWVVDEVKVRKVALAGVEIPGVVVKEETTIAVK